MKGMTFSEAYRCFWKKTFDYRGTASIEEYWMPTALHLVLFCIALCWFFAGLVWDLPSWPSFLIGIYLLLCILPGISLTVRRLNDTGRNPALAWLLLIAGIGTVIVLLLCTGPAGSRFSPFHNINVNAYAAPYIDTDYDPSDNVQVPMYGMPDFDPSEDASEYDPSQDLPVTEYGMPFFDPSENQNVDVYGPPEWFEQSAEEDPEETVPPETVPEETVPETESPETFEPGINLNPLVYGPPEWFSPSNPFDPSENILQPEYGVPIFDPVEEK